MKSQVFYNKYIMRVPRINIDQLVTFYFVAKERGLTAASEQLHVTPPAVTTQIKGLEQRFGVKLISVKKKRCCLTNAGRLLLRYAESVYQFSLQAEDLLLSYRNSLRVGVSGALIFRFIPIVDQFRVASPRIGITLREGHSLEILEELTEFHHDLAIVATPRSLEDGLERFRLPQPEEFILVVSPDAPLAKREKVTWQDLKRQPIIVYPEGSLSREVVLEEFEKVRIKPLIAASVDSVEGMKMLIEQQVGAGVMLPGNVERDVAIKRLKTVPLEEPPKLWIDLVWHRALSLSPALQSFLSIICKHFDCHMS